MRDKTMRFLVKHVSEETMLKVMTFFYLQIVTILTLAFYLLLTYLISEAFDVDFWSVFIVYLAYNFIAHVYNESIKKGLNNARQKG